MRILITGAGGFVGPHLVKALKQILVEDIKVVSTALHATKHPIIGDIEALDVTDAAAVVDAVVRHHPSHIVHLAGIASPTAVSTAAGEQIAWRVHLQGTLNVAHAILERSPNCNLIFVGSGKIYGASARAGAPMNEQTLLAPLDEYSVTKAAADLALGALAAQGLHCIRLRPFNHTGPLQTSDFVVPSFAMQIARIEAGIAPAVIQVGNLDNELDFLDVRDVVSLYALTVQEASELPAGTILNVASGVARRTGDILEQLVKLSGVEISIELDPTRLRPCEVQRIVGDASLARRLLGWAPKYEFQDTLQSVLNYWRQQVSSLKHQPNRAVTGLN